MPAPIDPKDYIHGVKVVDIGDLRVARGKTRRPISSCRHRKLVYDAGERQIHCSDCETNIEPFDAFTQLIEQHSGAWENIKRRMQAVKDAESFSLRSRAAKAIDKEWRSRSTVPACPHCCQALLPEDFVNGMSCVSAEIARKARERR